MPPSGSARLRFVISRHRKPQPTIDIYILLINKKCYTQFFFLKKKIILHVFFSLLFLQKIFLMKNHYNSLKVNIFGKIPLTTMMFSHFYRYSSNVQSLSLRCIKLWFSLNFSLCHFLYIKS
jgi:hypothetical protein